MQAAGPFAMEMILLAVKMHGKMCFSIAANENHVKIKAAGPFAILTILPGRKNAWKIVFFNCGR